jgi:hypothetical protein
MDALHALAALDQMNEATKSACDEALPAANDFVQKLPLVRVVVPPFSPRMETETCDVLREGKLLTSHRGKSTERIDAALGVATAVYFHAGRTHPDYGKVALVFRPLEQEERAEVTPFGLGALICDQKEEKHALRSCLGPIAHQEEAVQARFVAASTWRSGWRQDQAPRFLAYYFGAALDAYFAAEADGRPERPDPAGIFHPDDGCRDWRGWTFEVRIAETIALHAILDSGRILMWAMDKQLYNDVAEQASRDEAPWWFTKLRRSRRIGAPGDTFQEMLRAVDAEVKQSCLG